MKKYILFKKLSKKEQKKINDSKRNIWHFNPVSRVVLDKKKQQNKLACRGGF